MGRGGGTIDRSLSERKEKKKGGKALAVPEKTGGAKKREREYYLGKRSEKEEKNSPDMTGKEKGRVQLYFSAVRRDEKKIARRKPEKEFSLIRGASAAEGKSNKKKGGLRLRAKQRGAALGWGKT